MNFGLAKVERPVDSRTLKGHDFSRADIAAKRAGL
jgi:hypothetical protein